MITFITSPSVHVLSTPLFFSHPEYEVPSDGSPAERLIAHGGKGCYDSYGSDGRSVQEHIQGIITSRHGSVLEHANISIFIKGISRGCSHEVVRHRAGFAYSQRSTRYTNEDNANFILDPYYSKLQGLENSKLINLDESAMLNGFKKSCEQSLVQYKRHTSYLMEENPEGLKGTDLRKWARGKSRQLLPHALETRMTMTGNLRAWRFFLEERSGIGAEAEIRRLAQTIMHNIQPVAPFVFADMFDTRTTYQGFEVYIPRVKKV